MADSSDIEKKLNQREAELDAINGVQEKLLATNEMQEIYNVAGNSIQKLFEAQIVVIHIFDLDKELEHIAYTHGNEESVDSESHPLSKISRQLMDSKEPLLIHENAETVFKKITEKESSNSLGNSIPKSALFVPIATGNSIFGYITVQNPNHKHAFYESDVRFLSILAKSMSMALQNAVAQQKLQTTSEDLKHVQEQLLQQEKLASLGQLTAGVAHEIKNPLNFVNNFSEISVELLEEAREEIESAGAEVPLQDVSDILDDIEANLKKITEHGNRADSIVRSMLQHSREGSGTIEPTNINALIKEYVNLSFHGMRAGKHPINVDIELNLDENAKEIPLIAEDFSRVILNLCNNAFDAMREKLQSTDTNTSETEKYLPRLKVLTRKTGETLRIEIEDNGPGIPDDLKDKILQPFFTTKKGKEGTGLGLSITNDIVKSHGGTIDIQSKPGICSAFLITIPYNNL